MLGSGARWSDLPERYGKYKSVHARFMRWARTKAWGRIFDDLVQYKKNQYLMINSTIVRAHQQATTGLKRGSENTALGVPEVDYAPRSICWPTRMLAAIRIGLICNADGFSRAHLISVTFVQRTVIGGRVATPSRQHHCQHWLQKIQLIFGLNKLLR